MALAYGLENTFPKDFGFSYRAGSQCVFVNKFLGRYHQLCQRIVIQERSLYAYREQNKSVLWRLLSYMPKYLRSYDVIELVVLCLIG